MNLKEFMETPCDTVVIDWEEVQDELGFDLHDNIKNFYSRTFEKCKEFEIKFKDFLFTSTGNEKFDKWLLDNELNDYRNFVELYSRPKNEEKHVEFIENMMWDWTGGNEFGERLNVAVIDTNIGQILININNDTGNFEWIDCGYGYFDVYEENPNGIFSATTDEFLQNMLKCKVK